VSKFSDDRPSDLGDYMRRKKKKKNDSSKTEEHALISTADNEVNS